jgi:hypothetical protein
VNPTCAKDRFTFYSTTISLFRHPLAEKHASHPGYTTIFAKAVDIRSWISRSQLSHRFKLGKLMSTLYTDFRRSSILQAKSTLFLFYLQNQPWILSLSAQRTRSDGLLADLWAVAVIENFIDDVTRVLIGRMLISTAFLVPKSSLRLHYAVYKTSPRRNAILATGGKDT